MSTSAAVDRAHHAVAPAAASSSAVGSSASRRAGRPMAAAAKATRCCSPPESSAGGSPTARPDRPPPAGRLPLRVDATQPSRQHQLLHRPQIGDQVVGRVLQHDADVLPAQASHRTRPHPAMSRPPTSTLPAPAGGDPPAPGAATTCPSPTGPPARSPAPARSGHRCPRRAWHDPRRRHVVDVDVPARDGRRLAHGVRARHGARPLGRRGRSAAGRARRPRRRRRAPTSASADHQQRRRPQQRARRQAGHRVDRP